MSHLARIIPNKSWGTYKNSDYGIRDRSNKDRNYNGINLCNSVTSILQAYPVNIASSYDNACNRRRQEEENQADEEQEHQDKSTSVQEPLQDGEKRNDDGQGEGNFKTIENFRSDDEISGNENTGESEEEIGGGENVIEGEEEIIGGKNAVEGAKEFNSGEEEIDGHEDGSIKGHKRGRKPTPDNWKMNVAKKRRNLGQDYEARKKINGQWVTIQRGARKMGEMCSKESCKNSTKKNCDIFTDEDRRNIFAEFWKSGDKHVQDTFIQTLVDQVDKKTSGHENSRKKFSRVFHLKKNGETLQVCKEMFLSTLSISQQVVNRSLQVDKEKVGISSKVVKQRNPTPSRGFRWTDEDQLFLKQFFDLIPKAPGHYCRKDSSKIYLSSLVPSMSRLHELYVTRCHILAKNNFSICKFTEYFKANNFSLFKRKKDRCNTCVGHEEGNVADDLWTEHQMRKNEGFALKEKDKEMADNNYVFVITADTEALLTVPRNNANIMFFHSRLNLHNFTFYDLKTREVLNYVWSENNGDIESNNFTTCYINYLTTLVSNNPGVEKIILWSDGCTYQNRCNILSSALLTFAVKNKVEIWHKYLEVGHTHMECDSVHSRIESAIRNSTSAINLPSDYIDLIKNARKKKPGKYGVHYIDSFEFFKDFKSVSDIKTIKPKKEVGPPYVVNIRQLHYHHSGTIKINLTYDENMWVLLPYQISLRKLNAPQLYFAPLEIGLAKYKSLQEVKTTIPQRYWYFYDNLQHE